VETVGQLLGFVLRRLRLLIQRRRLRHCRVPGIGYSSALMMRLQAR
jgi:hypothetical protein